MCCDQDDSVYRIMLFDFISSRVELGQLEKKMTRCFGGELYSTFSLPFPDLSLSPASLRFHSVTSKILSTSLTIRTV